jgi:hypothetical protein
MVGIFLRRKFRDLLKEQIIFLLYIFIYLTAELVKLIMTLKDDNDNRKKILGDTFNPHSLVFCN